MPTRALYCAAFPRVPEPLADQLRTGGPLVQPIGQGVQEHVELYGAYGYDQR